MSNTTPNTATLELIPDPLRIHLRLGEIERERRLLTQQLRVSMAAKRELEERAEEQAAEERKHKQIAAVS